jgi:hypothetical protein
VLAFDIFVVTVSGSPNQQWVTQVYLDLLHRHVDAGGLATWTGLLDQGVSRLQVVQAIESSLEYRTDVVTSLYSRILQRAVDPSGLATWTTFLAQGGTAEQLQAELFGSDEYFQKTPNDNINFLSVLYGNQFGRAIDQVGALGWNQLLNSGVSRTAVALAIGRSLEADQDEVLAFYHQYLHRPADPGGLAALTSALGQGATNEQILALVVASEEYFDQA